MLPGSTDLLQSGDHVGSKAAFTIRGSVEDEVAVPLVLGDQPLVHDAVDGLKLGIGVALLPEPAVGKSDARLGGDAAVAWQRLSGVLLERFDVGIVEGRLGVLAGV